MKLSLLLGVVITIGLASAKPSSTFGLQEDLSEFIDLLPKAQIAGIVLDYLANDAEVQDAFEFIMSDDFKALLYDIEGIKEYQNFLKYLQQNGLNVYYYLSELHKLLEMDPFVPPGSRNTPRRGTGVRGMLDEIEAILPYDAIRELYYRKLQTSPAFKNLIDVMRGDEFKSIITQLRENPRFQEVIDRLEAHGVDIQLIIDLLNKIFGWGIETKRHFM